MQDNQFNQAIRGAYQAYGLVQQTGIFKYNVHVLRFNFISNLNFIILCFKNIIIYFYDIKQTERKKNVFSFAWKE